MQHDQLFPVIFAEFLRLETQERLLRLNNDYSDGGRASGERQSKLAEAALEAYANASHAIKKIGG